MFSGFVALGDSFKGIVLVRNGQETPVNADASPVFKVYGPGGLMQGGTGIAAKLDSDPGLYEYALAIDPSNGYEVGTSYRVFVTATVLGLAVAYEQSFIVS